MVGCIYELNGEVKSYPNMERLLKKFPNATILKQIENVKDLDREYRAYLGENIKERRPKEEQRPYTHIYRLNVNTVLCAYSQEDLDKLKKRYGVI